MTIEKIAYHLNRRDEVPNQELAKHLAEQEDIEGISEIASYLSDKNKSISSDCLKVLYEIGYLKPSLISKYLDEFISLLNSKNNRKVWGAMIGISSIAKVEPDKVYSYKTLIEKKIETGSLITHVWGIYTLINLASNGYYDDFKDKLFEFQKTCRPIDFAKRAESIMPILKADDQEAFIKILSSRQHELSKAAQKRVNKVINSKK